MNSLVRVAMSVAGVVAALVPNSAVAEDSSRCSNLSHSCTATDDNPTVVEPILTRSSLVPVTTDQASLASNRLINANIVEFSLTADAGYIRARITMQGPIIREISSAAQILPYAGQHLLVLFQTREFEIDHIIGVDKDGNDVHWGPPGYLLDGFRWVIAYGWKSTTIRDDCFVGYYNPFAPMIPPIDGSRSGAFHRLAYHSNQVQTPTSCASFSADGRTVTIAVPYTYEYSDRSGLLARRLPLVLPGMTVQNVSAFSWTDGDANAPDPLPNVPGFWPTDAVPSFSFDRGWAGAGNGRIPGFNCFYDDPNPTSGEPETYCGIAENPTGPRFLDSHLNFAAGCSLTNCWPAQEWSAS